MSTVKDDLIRCPACRGSKHVAKLGGCIGECNTCSGTGKIKQIDKPVPVVSELEQSASDIINAVSQALPTSDKLPETVDIEDVHKVFEKNIPEVKAAGVMAKAKASKVFSKKRA